MDQFTVQDDLGHLIKRLFMSFTERLSTNYSNTPCVTSTIGMTLKTSYRMLFFPCGLTRNVIMKLNPYSITY